MGKQIKVICPRSYIKFPTAEIYTEANKFYAHSLHYTSKLKSKVGKDMYAKYKRVI